MAEPQTGLTRRRALTTTAWAAPAIVVASAAHAEAALVPGVEVRCAPDLGTVVRALRREAAARRSEAAE